MAASKVSLKINNNTIIKPPRRCSAAIQTTHVVNRFGDRQVFFGEYLKTSKILGTPAEDWESGFKCIHIIFYRFQVEHSWRLSPPCNEYIHVENNVVFFFLYYRRRSQLRRVTMWPKVAVLSVVRDTWFIFACVTFIFLLWQWNKEIICL